MVRNSCSRRVQTLLQKQRIDKKSTPRFRVALQKSHDQHESLHARHYSARGNPDHIRPMSTPHPRQAEADAIEMTVAELEELDANIANEQLAAVYGIEVWELRMRREGAKDSAIEAYREELRKSIEKALEL